MSEEFKKDYPIRRIFHDHLDEIRRLPSLNDTQRSAALLISKCKTAELGFNASLCPNCGIQVHYASCNNRNCPCCQWPSQQSWIMQRENEVIPDIPYYHIILTVPHDLNPLIQSNEKMLLGKLFSCSSQAVIDLCSDRHFLGAVPGIVSVLHTWKQDLFPHYHIHMIVSGGGLNPLGQFVSQNELSRNRKKQPEFEGGFFLPMAALTKLFRGKMMDAVKRLWGKNLLDESYGTFWFRSVSRSFISMGRPLRIGLKLTINT